MNPARFRWGLLLIIAGILIILHNADRLYWDFWWDLVQWWPVLLIAIGLEKLFIGLRLKALAFVPPVLLAAGIVYLAVADNNYRTERWSYASSGWEEKFDPDVEELDVYIDHGRNDLKVKRTSKYLAKADFDRYIRKPKIDFKREGNTARLTVDSELRFGGRFINIRNYGDRDWDFMFSETVPLKLECIGDEASLRLDLSGIILKELTVENDDGLIDVTIGDRVSDVRLSIAGKNSRLYLGVPATAGLEIGGGDYSGYYGALGLMRLDDKFISEGFDTAATKIYIDIGAGLKHLSIQQK